MLNKLKELFNSKELLKGNYGLEREGLRVNEKGELSLRHHPEVFGDKVSNPYITTDFSESQIEVITPTFENIEETYKFNNALYDIVAMEIEDEYIWPQSMPCKIPDNDKIPVAKYADQGEGTEAQVYRENLLKKYGGKKQLISGIHYNFSFSEEFIEKLYNSCALNDKCFISNKNDFKEFKNSIYLRLARNYLRYNWLIIYLLGGTATLHESYIGECKKNLEKIANESFTNSGALSYRNGECGYKNKVDLFPNYNSISEYVESLKNFIHNKVIDSHKELYSSIRLKAKNQHDFLNSLIKDGVSYLEYRSIDINPYEKGGISLEDLYFLQIFSLFLLIEEESDYENWQEESLENQNLISRSGQNDIMLKRDGKLISKEKFALDILKSINNIDKELGLGRSIIIDKMIKKVKNHKLTYAYLIAQQVKEQGYINAHLNLAKEHRNQAFKNRFKLEGHEELELSTQIVMKEAIKRGIKVDVIDKAENFIYFKKNGHVEYVKQATKTSKDNYVTVLIMENKSVTKKILSNNNIKVPQGKEFNSIEEVKTILNSFINKPTVIKPKSTNFGTGISIFPQGTDEESIIKAFEIAFKYDNTVLIEEFISGKEYRFLVIDNKVVGVLHRVPANVKGDGEKSIGQLVEIKNQDPLRGYHYVTPLEKINLDENAELFLKQQNKDFSYVPNKNEIVYLRENSNISTGGDSIDYTDDIPERFKQIAVDATKAVNAKFCGVDMMINDYKDQNSDYAIIELNFNPAIHIHCFPYKGTERKIGVEVLKALGLL